ncbi:Glycosyltransferase involved in cell wall bisynthesis [Soonwooa buanensis]|uniref:Glycosyltransferase involved in cell wall bisynthesis n=1 Tax=Soonwooa buanensis TaxID=619805 RepID=A0A1T5EB18_9FLAO|nr:glycosyltransferase family 2 protein [Soonwooa buanensis]SKB81198.1 Glycosyltransferase involved in cell wall bisynthesis [Soonwooa buanensis]
MLFSILVAHYNNWDYFQDCYNSIKNQTYQNLEIIIVDDCSTDGSYEKLQELAKADSRIQLFRNNVNSKVGFTKRRCIEEANGEICGFLDPDDFLTNTAVEESALAYKGENCIATYSKIKLVNDKGKAVGDFKYSREIPQHKNLFFNINFEVAHFFTFKKSTYSQTEGIDPALTSAVDQDLYLKLYEKGNFKFINSFQYLYRLHDKGVSQDKSKKAKLNENWHKVILATCHRRKINKLYGKNVAEITDLPKYIFEKENSFFKKLLRKLS